MDLWHFIHGGHGNSEQLELQIKLPVAPGTMDADLFTLPGCRRVVGVTAKVVSS